MSSLHPPAAAREPLRAGRWCWLVSLAVLAATSLAPGGEPARPAAAKPDPGSAVLQELRSFATTATLLHVAAHPDDENTHLITYFARGRGYRTGYLSITRGDGGQNEIGPEFDEKLGVARTHELLVARALDGGRQFFTRAIDFGYSKSPEETLRFWNRHEVLGDVVRIIRQFRPDVIVTRFSPTAGGTHGHHTASAILALEAFRLSGDANAYPEQLRQGLPPWQAKRIVWNGYGGGRGGGAPAGGSSVKVDIGGNDPVTGEAFGMIAGRSRGMHITQGFGGYSARGTSGPNEQTFVLLAGEPATQDLLDGVDTTWSRFPGGETIGRQTDAVIAGFKPGDPAASLPALLEIRRTLGMLANGPVVADKQRQLDGIIQRCLGLEVETLAPTAEAVPGESIPLQLTARMRASVPVKWIHSRSLGGEVRPQLNLPAGGSVTRELTVRLPDDLPVTHPYWLREDHSEGMARVSDPALIGRPENPPAVPVEHVFEVGGQTLTIAGEPLFLEPAGTKGPPRRRIDIIAPVSLAFGSAVAVVSPGGTRRVALTVTTARASTAGTVQLEVPAGWSAVPMQRRFQLARVGEQAKFEFELTAPAQAAAAIVGARATVQGKDYRAQRTEIRYPHIPVQVLQPPARLRTIAVSVEKRGATVGYLPGAGDDTAEALAQLGYSVRTLTGADLTAEKLRGLDAVVIGVRAFNERRDLAANLPALFVYVENGGTVVAQYNRPNGLRAEPLGPYALSIQGAAPALRVTDETAPVKILAPDHPALTTPNRIGPADFAGWVQERGAYFASSWDQERYVPLFAMSDPGESPLKSSVLVARHGRGYYVYTGIAFFRQLPAGVPGAYRLFANLVSLGQ